MIESISEIKANLEKLFSLFENEALEQRREILALTQRVKQMEDFIQGQREADLMEKVKPVEVTQRVEQVVSVELDVPVIPVVLKVPVEPVRTVFAPSIFDRPSVSEELPKVNSFSIESDEDSMFEVVDAKRDDSRQSIIGDIFALSSTVADTVKKSSPAWMVDRPGERVSNLADAISINDRVIFVRELFDYDNEQFVLTLDRLNEIGSLAEGVNYLRSAFPTWDEGSDSVYRFYMIVRRRFRS